MSDFDEDTLGSFNDTLDSATPSLDPLLRAKQVPNRGKENVRRASLGMGSQRGKNWSEEDLLLLLKAYGWIEENKKSITPSKDRATG
jgi:hypothetical protein